MVIMLSSQVKVTALTLVVLFLCTSFAPQFALASSNEGRQQQVFHRRWLSFQKTLEDVHEVVPQQEIQGFAAELSEMNARRILKTGHRYPPAPFWNTQNSPINDDDPEPV